MTTLRLHNTASGRVEEFTPLESGHVRMYSCGPTVHDFSHIGNFRTTLFEDLLHRLLETKGYKVTHVRNLTDVEDRIIRKSQEKGVDIDTYTAPYIVAFFEDLATLRVRPADVYPRATRHIDDMVALIQRLAAGGHTYQVEGSHYFRIATFPKYGSLARLDPTKLKAGARVDVDEYGKDDPRDFALWKARKPGEHFWDKPLGAGRPGWHIECSAMSMRYLGETFDIHTGGVDLIFPHHEDEIAQSEAATGKPFVRYWLHAAHLTDATGEKMSKRLKNFATVRDLLAEGVAPRAIRYALLTGAHYRKPLNFSSEILVGADSSVRRLNEFAVRLQAPEDHVEPAADIRQRWDDALADNLNIEEAVGQLFGWIRTFNTRLEAGGVSLAERAGAMAMLRHADRILDVIEFPGALDDADITRLIELRRAARAAGNFARSDEIRELLRQRGIQLDDTKEGSRWKRIS